MSKIAITGAATGTATFTIESPATSTNRTLTIPDATTTIVGTDATQTLTNKSMVATQLTGTIAAARLPAGSVLQVVQATHSTEVTTTSSSFVTTNLTASITPSSASNKILILCNTHGASANISSSAIFTIFRGTVAGTDLGSGEGFGSSYSTAGGTRAILAIHFLDSPSTTSSQAYTLGFRAGASGNTQTAQLNNAKAVMVLMEIAG